MTRQEAEDYLYNYFKNILPEVQNSSGFVLPSEFIEARNILGEELTRDIYEDTRPEPNTWDIAGDL